ncbi:MAG: TetR/AcrR family transcriptional regulator [Deltaproteobacteria bacterium]|jgi:AcrR family transcriptional regulator|nr:TetR/AcrR family transcriptional regulator [Deltaproteobacteria bacterium]MBW2499823.1 TetR/AcrR family transcriptional regulator [Deltaproteobacteria bacterium]
MGASAETPQDGRIQRSARSREAIVHAMLELIAEGVLRPTAQQVALRADVGVRTVFRHFSDMESLFSAMSDRLREEARPLFVDAPQSGSRAARIEALVSRRMEIFALLGPFLRASAIQRWHSAVLQEEHERMIRTLRRDLQHWLPEHADAESDLADAIELLLSFESWDRLRTGQKLGPKRASQALRRAVLELAGSLDRRRA